MRVVILWAILLFPLRVLAQFAQQGPKLVGTGADSAAVQGCSVAISGDGSTAIVGGETDDVFTGATWVWTRRGGTWSQQGHKLIGGSGGDQGASVALSADGNTAIVGEPGAINLAGDDFALSGGATVWTRNGGVWTNQAELLGAGIVNALQGYAVALSADGNTAIVATPFDDGSMGATWVWTRSGGVWTQQGPKLVGSGFAWPPRQGASVSLSADGNTLIVGAPLDGSSGAIWVWTRSGGIWAQQGSKLVGSGSVGFSGQGTSVSISADGNTAMIGGPYDDGGVGAVWVWTRGGAVWTQQGSKLVGSNAIGPAQQGTSVSLSGDGMLAVVGGPNDNNGQPGAVWIWARTGDAWVQRGEKLVGSGDAGAAHQGKSVALSRDGTTFVVGGPADNAGAGAAWVFSSYSVPAISPWQLIMLAGVLALLGILRIRV